MGHMNNNNFINMFFSMEEDSFDFQNKKQTNWKIKIRFKICRKRSTSYFFSSDF